MRIKLCSEHSAIVYSRKNFICIIHSHSLPFAHILLLPNTNDSPMTGILLVARKFQRDQACKVCHKTSSGTVSTGDIRNVNRTSSGTVSTGDIRKVNRTSSGTVSSRDIRCVNRTSSGTVSTGDIRNVNRTSSGTIRINVKSIISK